MSSNGRAAFWRWWLEMAGFFAYASVLLTSGHWIGHHWFVGWVARLVSVAWLALGLLPWSHWLAPRMKRVLATFSWYVLVGCYFTLLIPFAVGLWLAGGRRRWHWQEPESHWRTRPLTPTTLATAQIEG